MVQRLVCCVVLAGSVACVDKHGHYDGQVEGRDFDVADAAYFAKYYDGGADSPSSRPVSVAVAVMSTSYTMCDDIRTQRLQLNEQTMFFAFLDLGATALTPLQGTIPLGVGAGSSAFTEYIRVDETCRQQTPIVVSNGSMTFTSGNYASKENAAADFSVVWQNGDQGSGSIDAAPCDAPKFETFLDSFVREILGDGSQSGTHQYLIEGPC